MRTYKDYVKNPKRVEGYIVNRYVFVEAILYCMEYIPNGRKGTHKRGRPTFMDDDANKNNLLTKATSFILKHLSTNRKYDIYLRDYMRASRHRGSTNLGKPLDYILLLREQEEYVVPEVAKRKLIKSANILWRNRKKTLRKKYDEWDTKEARKKNFLKKIRPEYWVRFVDLTSIEEVKASRERNKINRSALDWTCLHSSAYERWLKDSTWDPSCTCALLQSLKQLSKGKLEELRIKIEELTMSFEEASVFKSYPDIINLLVGDGKKLTAKDYLLQKKAKLSERDVSYIDLFGAYTIKTIIVYVLGIMFNHLNELPVVRVSTLIDHIDNFIRVQSLLIGLKSSKIDTNRIIQEDNEKRDNEKAKKCKIT
ncbi:hypothetical protein GIB67_018554 [Kingdonia uniflora]|uniref:Uncharacterized protein n=1 Tax=Kingdonia uniflora TaxID=39325 RepID=A0A7J7LW57_9MAGN|nr:hypothetical protein GIB67_018554 [Kingdonia uniflora]